MGRFDKPLAMKGDIEVLIKGRVTPAINKFVNNMPEDKWRHLESGDPDQDTRYMIVHLLKHIVNALSGLVLDRIRNFKYNYGDVKHIIGNRIPEAFAQIMGIEENYQSETTEIFNVLFIKHVITEVTRRFDQEDPKQWLNISFRSNSLIQNVAIMLQELMARKHAIDTEKTTRPVHAVEESPMKSPRNPPKSKTRRVHWRQSRVSPADFPGTKDTQVKHPEKVTNTPKDGIFEFTPREDFESEEMKDDIRLFVKWLMGRSVAKSKMSCCFNALKATEERVVEKIWAKIKGQNFQIKQKWFPSLSKKVFDDVKKMLGCPSQYVLGFMQSEHKLIDNAIVSSFKNQLWKQQEKRDCSIKKLLSCIGRTIMTCKLFGKKSDGKSAV
ncbi:uncharacterized protein LOC118557479 [Fundulus heteroclitus]|uniref:uncharacterized protein LOC118557479 n=1 Tax=Fundulus heteroclitus TaxID=8078 RepID=UPI00165CB628|nr:uncharacterized protein LOC118557479 [Fundulus heteroclitus]